MRYGIRYNPNKKRIEYLDIDEVDPNELIDVIEADDYFDAQNKFKSYLNDCVDNITFVDYFKSRYNEELETAVRNYYSSLGVER